jgi:amidophosphoribosyltransferase
VQDKKIGLVDDSIVRGDTTKVTIKRLKKKGVKNIHLFITFPQIISPCFYGIDMATYGELIGASHEPEMIAKIIGADSVNYQSINNFIRAIGLPKDELCLGCITGKYPTPQAQQMAEIAKKNFEEGHNETGRIYEVIS